MRYTPFWLSLRLDTRWLQVSAAHTNIYTYGTVCTYAEVSTYSRYASMHLQTYTYTCIHKSLYVHVVYCNGHHIVCTSGPLRKIKPVPVFTSQFSAEKPKTKEEVKCVHSLPIVHQHVVHTYVHCYLSSCCVTKTAAILIFSCCHGHTSQWKQKLIYSPLSS